MTDQSLTIIAASHAGSQPTPTPTPSSGPVERPVPGRPEPDPGGQELPASGKAPPAKLDLGQAVEQINRFLADSRRSLVFEVDEASGRTIIRVVNPETSEVVREIPPAEVSVLAHSITQGNLRLINEFA